MYQNNYNYNHTYSIREVSEIVGIERSAIYRLIKNKKIIPNITKPIRVGKINLQKYVLQKAPKAPILWEQDHPH